jgi:hypothetical protein
VKRLIGCWPSYILIVPPEDLLLLEKEGREKERLLECLSLCMQ